MSRSLFDRIDKTEGMAAVLDRLGIRYRPGHLGWQKISCPNGAGHSKGVDRNPSCSLSLQYGAVNCHSCGFHGDWARIMYEIEGMKVDEAVKALGLEGHEGSNEAAAGDDLFRY